MIKQIKNYFYERFTDFTISPPNFLPMIVTTRDKATQLMEGKLEMLPILSREQVETLEAEIRRKYPRIAGEGIYHKRISDQYCRSVYTWIFYDSISI